MLSRLLGKISETFGEILNQNSRQTPGKIKKSPSPPQKKRSLRFETMEDRCLLSIDPGTGAFDSDVVYGPITYEDWLKQSSETALIADFQEVDQTLFQSALLETSIKENCPSHALQPILALQSGINAAALPCTCNWGPMVHSLTTVNNTAKEDGTETLKYETELLSWGDNIEFGTPAFEGHDCNVLITSEIQETFAVRTTQTNLRNGSLVGCAHIDAVDRRSIFC